MISRYTDTPCGRCIHEAEEALGRDLDKGEKSDLLLDNFPEIADSDEAHALVHSVTLPADTFVIEGGDSDLVCRSKSGVTRSFTRKEALAWLRAALNNDVAIFSNGVAITAQTLKITVEMVAAEASTLKQGKGAA